MWFALAFLKYIYIFFALWSTISRSPKSQLAHIVGKPGNLVSGLTYPPTRRGMLANAMADRCPKFVVDSPSLRPLSRPPLPFGFYHSNQAERALLHALDLTYAFHTSSGG